MSERRATMITTDPPPPHSTGELRALARVIIPALYLLLQHWQLNSDRFPPSHPYRQAATMVLRYLERTYG